MDEPEDKASVNPTDAPKRARRGPDDPFGFCVNGCMGLIIGTVGFTVVLSGCSVLLINMASTWKWLGTDLAASVEVALTFVVVAYAAISLFRCFRGTLLYGMGHGIAVGATVGALLALAVSMLLNGPGPLD